jgi:hypothetical protein
VTTAPCLQTRGDRLEHVGHRRDGCGDHDEIGVADGADDIPRGAVDRLELLGIALVLQARVESDDLERRLAVGLVGLGPSAEAEADGSSDEAQADDGDGLHRRRPLPALVVDRALAQLRLERAHEIGAKPALAAIFRFETHPRLPV